MHVKSLNFVESEQPDLSVDPLFTNPSLLLRWVASLRKLPIVWMCDKGHVNYFMAKIEGGCMVAGGQTLISGGRVQGSSACWRPWE